MALTTLSFDNTNFSAQVGDIIYFTTGGGTIGANQLNPSGFSSAELQNTKRLGVITGIGQNPSTLRWDITVEYNAVVVSPPSNGDYISFAKDKRVNTSSLLGYYASVTLKNNSQEKAELFNVGADVFESSK